MPQAPLKKNSEANSEYEESCKTCYKLYGLWNNVPLYSEEIEHILHEEIVFFEAKINDVNTARKTMFDKLIAIVEAAIKDIIPAGKVYLYGSYATGLSMPWSDIDMVIDIPDDGMSPLDILPQIEKSLEGQDGVVADSKFIRQASIPVLKIVCTEKYLDTKIDVCLHEPRHTGITCVTLVKDYLFKYSGMLRPLVLVLKQMLYMTQLNDPYQGGLSSYGIIL